MRPSSRDSVAAAERRGEHVGDAIVLIDDVDDGDAAERAEVVRLAAGGRVEGGLVEIDARTVVAALDDCRGELGAIGVGVVVPNRHGLVAACSVGAGLGVPPRPNLGQCCLGTPRIPTTRKAHGDERDRRKLQEEVAAGDDGGASSFLDFQSDLEDVHSLPLVERFFTDERPGRRTLFGRSGYR